MNRLPEYRQAIAQYNVYTSITFGRWVCATVLHFSLLAEISSALVLAKYAVNHTYMFKDPYTAFITVYM